MRKPAVPRFVLLLVLYLAIFAGLVYLQFARKTNFTLRAGNIVVQGNYQNNPKQAAGVYALSGETSVFFGGMEFVLGEGLMFSNGSAVTPTLPQLMIVTDNDISFRLIEGPELVFTTQYTGGSVELVIRVDFSAPVDSLNTAPAGGFDGAVAALAASSTVNGQTAAESPAGVASHSLTIPFKPIRTSIIQERGQQLLIRADGANYTFSRNTGRDSLTLETYSPAISYRVLPGRETASPADFIIPAAQNSTEYETAVALWLDQAYMLWNRSVAGGGEVNGELISAYMSEALKRGTYRAAAAAVSASWKPENLFYEASAYTGRLDTAIRTLSVTEREQSTRLARLFNEKSVNFLRVFHIIEYLAVRGYDNLIDDATEILRGFDPAEMTVAQAAGILEGRFDWNRYRPGHYNPFDRFVDQALFVITGSMRKNPREGSVLVFSKSNSGEEAGIELNLRLGRILLRDEDETRIALGKTLILSVLSFADTSGAVPRIVQGNFTTNGERIASETVYRICFAGANYARVQAAVPGIWAWTAATSLGGSAGAGRLELSFEFPAGETHYAIVRGIKPFTILQLNGAAHNSDSQFERQDTSGWIYLAEEQTLLLKIRNRQSVERITILY